MTGAPLACIQEIDDSSWSTNSNTNPGLPDVFQSLFKLNVLREQLGHSSFWGLKYAQGAAKYSAMKKVKNGGGNE